MKKVLIGTIVILVGAITVPFIFASDEMNANSGQATQEKRFEAAEEKVFGENEEKAQEPTKVYEDDKTTIYFSKVSGKGVELLIENKMNYQITVQGDSIAINGVSVNKILMSDSIAPKSKGKVIVRCDTTEFEKEVKTVSGALNIIDFENYNNTYNVNFVNVEVK